MIEHSEQVRYQVTGINTRREIPYLEAAMYYSVYYINIRITTFLMIFGRFLNTFQRFPKILEKLSEGQTIINFLKIYKDCQRFSKKTEDFQGIISDVSIIQQHI